MRPEGEALFDAFVYVQSCLFENVSVLPHIVAGPRIISLKMHSVIPLPQIFNFKISSLMLPLIDPLDIVSRRLVGLFCPGPL